MSKRIIVLAGGGAHGITQLVALAKLESIVGPLYNYYDLMMGTSVGAINAAAIASGKITANNLLALYPSWLDIIFKKSWNPFQVPKYNRQNFINIWSKQFGTMKMKDVKTKLVITSVDACQDKNNYFKSYEDEDGQEDLMTVVMRSFAAPFFFGQIVDDVNKKVWYDGGVGGNNFPVSNAFTESIILNWFPNEEVTFDVFGTGYTDDSTPFDTAKKANWFGQVWNFMNIGDGGLARLQSREDQIDKMTIMAQSNSNIKFNYWDVQIDKKYDGLDNIGCKAQLIAYGETMAKAPLISIG